MSAEVSMIHPLGPTTVQDWRFEGYRLGEIGYRQEVRAVAGETVTAPGPVPIVVDTSQLR
ncbi:hypothetical protein [Nocardia sp. XZ_19_385]|uniref:hypothetical protein n=1 Tax=Nocardia sp. XZ_19_385 TaxID=2769488 RepID=UPI00189071CF|nr:hypothetical protein [Nocardia sp. XZ_19_385]